MAGNAAKQIIFSRAGSSIAVLLDRFGLGIVGATLRTDWPRILGMLLSGAIVCGFHVALPFLFWLFGLLSSREQQGRSPRIDELDFRCCH